MNDTAPMLPLASPAAEVLPAFEYSALPAPLADNLRASAKRIRDRISRQTEAIIETGRDLLAIKDQLDHGQFISWVESELSIAARTAQQYMRAAEWAGEKSATVAHLPPTTVYMLASKSTPAEISDRVLQDLEAGRPIQVDEVRQQIAEATDRRREERKVKARLERAARRGRGGRDVPEDVAKERAEAARQREAKRIEKEERERREREARHQANADAVAQIIRSGLSDADLDRVIEIMGGGEFWNHLLLPTLKAVRTAGRA